MNTEEWRTVVIDGEELSDYEVSSHGRVRSLNYRRTGQVKIMKQADNGNGYLIVNLWKNGKQKMCKVHRLVAMAFIPNPHNKATVNHIDEDKTNNCVDNLEWADMKEQINHGTRTERQAKTQGKRVLCVETGEILSVEQWAKRLNVDKTTVTKTCRKGQKTCKGLHLEYVDDTEETTEESENLCFKPLTLVA